MGGGGVEGPITRGLISGSLRQVAECMLVVNACSAQPLSWRKSKNV